MLSMPNRSALRILAAAWCLLSVGIAGAYTPGQPSGVNFPRKSGDFLARYCVDCHDSGEPAGGLSLEEAGPIDVTSAATWRNVWAQVTLKQMPPEDSDQPEVVERLEFTDGIVDQLASVLRDKGGFSAHRDPGKGNFVDHSLLFGEMPKTIDLIPTSSPARLWRVTPQEHITRLNELINTEPEFDAKHPGRRTHGDAVPTNHGGELKLYFGVDRILRWEGGTVAYATAVKSVPEVLSSARRHGLENYPDLYTVNGAESIQIMDMADDILRYMAYGPLSIASQEQITDDPRSYKIKGDIRGLPSSLVYSTRVARPLTPVHTLMDQPGVDTARVRAAVDYLFEALTFRPPRTEESNAYVKIVEESIQTLGKEEGALLGLTAIFLDRDALFRAELVEDGTPDAYGRVMLQDWELGLAVNHALCYLRPDQALRAAVLCGKMRTVEDVRREVKRMLSDDAIRKPRILQFFRDYLDYDLCGHVCKDNRALHATGVRNSGPPHYRAMFDAVASTDCLIEMILRDDTDVLKRLLTTDKVVATRWDRVYFGRQRSPEQVQAAKVATRQAEDQAVAQATDALRQAKQEVANLQTWQEEHPDAAPSQEQEQALAESRRAVASAERALNRLKKNRGKANDLVAEADLEGDKVLARVGRRSFGNGSMKPERVLATAPAEERLGVLTHPAWLVSHSDAMDNHAIRRGRWIRERLLGGGVPDVPITVDAMLPDAPDKTLRQRMQVTRQAYCWTCHQKMDPLGLPFEMYNHAGLVRTTELGRPVDTTGAITDSGDPELDGPVGNAIEMIEKLAESERVEQVFVRHAFRFWMGRNETLHDAPVLQAAHRAYRDNGGSFDALLEALLTSDAFLYRSRPARSE